MEKRFYLGDYVKTSTHTGRIFQKDKTPGLVMPEPWYHILTLNGGTAYVPQSDCELIFPLVSLNNPEEEFYFGH